MASTPPASPPGALQRPSSAALQMQRSSSRMSISSKQGGGSRASDEDGKTAVKVGEWSGEIVWQPAWSRMESTDGAMGHSGASASASEIDRSRVRIDSATVSTINVTCRLTHRPGGGFAPRPETLRLRPSIWCRCTARGCMGLRERECQCLCARVQRVGTGIWTIGVGEIIYNGHIRPCRAR